MSFEKAKSIIAESERELRKEISKIIDERSVQNKVLEEAKQTAEIQAKHFLDDEVAPPPEIPGILADSDEKDEYLFVLEYLESLGLKITPTVLRYESQHPEVQCDRKKLSRNYNLKNYDRTPLLVQLIEERLRNMEVTTTMN